MWQQLLTVRLLTRTGCALPRLSPSGPRSIRHSSICPYGENMSRMSFSLHFLEIIPINSFLSSTAIQHNTTSNTPALCQGKWCNYTYNMHICFTVLLQHLLHKGHDSSLWAFFHTWYICFISCPGMIASHSPLPHWSAFTFILNSMPRHACKCTKSNAVGSNMNWVGWQTASIQEDETSCATYTVYVLQFTVSLLHCRTHQCTMESYLLLCMLCFNKRDANNSHPADFLTSISTVCSNVLA